MARVAHQADRLAWLARWAAEGPIQMRLVHRGWVEWARRTSRKASHGCVGICQVRCRGSWLCVRSEWEHHGVAGALAGVWELGLFGMLWDGGGHRAPVSESADELVAAAGDIGRLAVGG